MGTTLGLVLFGSTVSAQDVKDDSCKQCLQCQKFCRNYENVSGCVANNCSQVCNTCDKLRGYRIIIMN